MDKTAAPPVANQGPDASGRFWPEGWWKLMEYRIGIIPLPVFVMMGALIAGFVVTGKISSEISMAIVYTVREQAITRLEFFLDRAEALKAAGLGQ